MRTVITLVLALLVSPALAEPFTSKEFGFSADFPDTPTRSAVQEGPRDAGGQIASTGVVFSASERGEWVTVLAIEIFQVERRLDRQGTLAAERDGFFNGRPGITHRSANDTFAGHPALRFTYEAKNEGLRGQGLVVLIETPKPRIYVVVATVRLSRETPAIAAALNRFLESFRLAD
jgi:hypothetical protein